MKLQNYETFIKLLVINLSMCICFIKIINNNTKIGLLKNIILFLTIILASFIQFKLQPKIDMFYALFPLIFIYGFLLGKLFKVEYLHSLIVSIVSLALTCIISVFAVLISSLIYASLCVLFNHFGFLYIDELGYILSSFMAIISILIVIGLFNIRKLKYGFSFLRNDYIKVQVLLGTTLVIFNYSVLRNYSRKYLYISLICVAVIFILAIKQVFILYQKQKLQVQALKDYEKQLNDIKDELRITQEEKEKIIKSNHEFYHRQEALKTKLNHLAKCNSEFANELSDITDRIDLLTNEYESKIRNQKQIETFGIEELDDMLIYFKEECAKYNIDFTCKVEGNINKIIDTIITKSEFETLTGDLLRNAIIAINHSENITKSIMLAFGLRDGFYELDIYDTGIPFEISTLLTLGVEKCSTHLNEGGTGIGFITTFETLNRTKASIVITEFNSNTYSKCIGIKFDNHNAYIINTNRVNEIKLLNKDNRQIVFNNTKDRI